MKKLVVMFLAFLILFSNFTTYVAAGENENSSSNGISEELIEKVSDYIVINSKGVYEIKNAKNLKEIISKDEFKLVKATIKKSNKVIEESFGEVSYENGSAIVFEMTDQEIANEIGVDISTELDDGDLFTIMKVGVSKVEVFWWGFKVYLSAGMIKNIAGGNTALYGFLAKTLPHPVARGVAAFISGYAAVVTVSQKNGYVLRFNFVTLPPFFILTSVKKQ